MIAFLKELFQDKPETQSTEDKEKSIRLACLVLLLEVAKADHSMDKKELDSIVAIAKRTYRLADEDIKGLLEQAFDHSDEATSLYEFTSLINDNFNEQEKFLLIKSMWKIAYADGQIDRYEEHLIRRAADLLYVEHVRFIEAKLAVESEADQ